MLSYFYFDVGLATHIHDQIIRISGGRSGHLDLGRLDSILEHLKNDQYYPEFVDKLAHLVFQVNKGHCFNDGNKRTSIALGALFLELNGLGGIADHFIIQMENIAVALADNVISKELLHEIIESLLTEEDYNEPLKLKIIDALNHSNMTKQAQTDDIQDTNSF
jgi:death-on-curing protein